MRVLVVRVEVVWVPASAAFAMRSQKPAGIAFAVEVVLLAASSSLATVRRSAGCIIIPTEGADLLDMASLEERGPDVLAGEVAANGDNAGVAGAAGFAEHPSVDGALQSDLRFEGVGGASFWGVDSEQPDGGRTEATPECVSVTGRRRKADKDRSCDTHATSVYRQKAVMTILISTRTRQPLPLPSKLRFVMT